ncbi:MAG: protein of unknown function transrane [Vampirovibrio sp.]|jgi:uncharacterized membrane protein SpoIIM required for sporulation|nr:protein of unknown function transrane [Vampirovibrio sp.]
MKQHELPIEYRQVYEELKGHIHTSSQRGLKRRGIDDIEAFAHQYLMGLGILSRLRANPDYRGYVPAFQKALLEANLLLYPEEDVSLRKIGYFLWTRLPAQLWENRYYYLASTAICLVSAVIGFLIVLQNFEMAPVFIPTQLRSSHELEAYLFSDNAQTEMLTAGRNGSASEKALFATALMINNIRVAIICFTMGLLFGLPTLLILVQTGLMLGTLPALFYRGDLVGLGAWLLPHGVPEISAILLSGGAGLKLGMCLLRPGHVSMGARIKKALKSVSGTVVVCVALLFWAGIVESFIRQSQLDNDTRYKIALFSCIPIGLVFLRAFFASQALKQSEGVARKS